MCRYDNLCTATEQSSKTAKTAKNQKFFQLCKTLVKKKSAILLKKGH